MPGRYTSKVVATEIAASKVSVDTSSMFHPCQVSAAGVRGAALTPFRAMRIVSSDGKRHDFEGVASSWRDECGLVSGMQSAAP